MWDAECGVWNSALIIPNSALRSPEHIVDLIPQPHSLHLLLPANEVANNGGNDDRNEPQLEDQFGH
jgi:hypothetical protein